MKKEFIPYEQAVELKELGFNEECLSTYTWDGFKYDVLTCISENQAVIKSRLNINNDKYTCSAPLYQQAFSWFRDKKLSDSCICRYQSRDDGGVYYYYCINHDFGVEETKHFEEGFYSYEEAELACLKKLIEIVKNK